ncbi:hypothetical protein BGZ73_002570 [Actinomortierella ambigua]|nr:hypothetical protein BGZ73_002570 [Actinomortierella ambigua]
MHSSSRFQQSPQAPSAHLPPPLPKAGIHPFSRSNSISHPFIHDSNSHAEADDDVGEPVALSASPSDMDIRHDSFTSSQRQWKWTKKSVPTGYGSGSSEQHLRRPSGMTMLLNSNDRPPNVQQLPPAALEILSQDFAPVTRSHVEKYLRRMDEKEYRRLESIVSEKYADHLEAHPWFLNNLTAMLCVIQEGDSDVQVKGPPSQGETDKSMVMDIDTAPPSSTRPALTFERIHLEKLSCQPTEQSWTKGLQGLTLTPHEEISNFVALFSEQKQHGDQSDNQFLPGRFNLPPHAYSLKDLLSKNFVVSAEPTQWGLYRFQEYPDLQFVVLKSVIQEYKRIKESIKAARHPSDNESHEEGDGDGDVDMAVDDRGSGNAAAKPRYRMALTLVEESGEQVPREVLETFGQFDWTLSGHVHRPCFVEQPPMGLSRSTKVWTRFDRLMWHPTESEILHRDYEMLLPPARLMDAQQQDRDEKRTDDDEAEAIAARFVHTDSLAPAILAFIWADMYMTYKTTGSLRHLEGDLPDSEEALANEEDEYGEYDDVAGEEEEEYGDEGKEKVEALRPHVTQDAEQQDAEDDDGADRISMPDSFKRWRMTRRSTTDSNSTIASRRESMMPPLPLAMSTIPAVPTTSTPTTSAIRSMTGSTVTPVEEQDEPLATPSVGKSSSICPTSMASPVSSMSAASAAAGRRISIAELCSPMLTLGNTSNASTNNSSK